nr:MAG TPA_asm: hypothetical protein [Caudoviricetes sp.]
MMFERFIAIAQNRGKKYLWLEYLSRMSELTDSMKNRGCYMSKTQFSAQLSNRAR